MVICKKIKLFLSVTGCLFTFSFFNAAFANDSRHCSCQPQPGDPNQNACICILPQETISAFNSANYNFFCDDPTYSSASGSFNYSVASLITCTRYDGDANWHCANGSTSTSDLTPSVTCSKPKSL
jgi:hypothetical protein